MSCLMKWPGHIPSGTTTDTMLMSIDILPTLARVIGGKLPDHRIDGLDCWPVICGEREAKNPHDFYAYYYQNNQLQAIVSGDGRWKLQLPHAYNSLPTGQPAATGGKPVLYNVKRIENAELYDLYADISESRNLAEQQPQEVTKLQKYAQEIRADLGDSLKKMPRGSGTREAGK